MISPADFDTLAHVPDVAKPSAMWLWLNLDPLGRGLLNPAMISALMYPTLDLTPDEVFEHLVVLTESGFLTTYLAPDPESRETVEWILLLHPLKVDLRGTKISTPEPPPALHGPSMAMGGGGRARARGSARERARAGVWAEDAARAAAWDAVQEDREPAPERPERPAVLDAPPMFCDEHMPRGAGTKKCGPCRDRRLLRDEWMQRRVYEDRLTEFYEHDQHDEIEEVWGGDPF
ncbi:hypothetical protein L687_12305 [Microbacterium maritypicum MF109]|uniref:Uncharacterized protein n=2 Tax=Microbacterium maritypicum TaxID=33918 RepID=T5KYJ6_MICMQ|nr:hypothetical protein L687_12305 [Microbacterium maritypicum MF109]